MIQLNHIASLFKLLSCFCLLSLYHITNSIGKPLQKGPIFAAIAVDAKNASVLYQHNARINTPPASLTKLMTLLMLFDALEQKKLTLTQKVPISKRSSGQPPCKLGLHPSSNITVKELILSLVTKSANDSACAAAELLAGSEVNFAKHMTFRAKEFGMKQTTFKNASGLPASGQITTAEDMAVLGLITLKHYKKYFHFFETRQFCYHKKCHVNHNYRLLSNKKFRFNGIKTGYTNLSKFNVISSHKNKHNQEIIIVILGGTSPTSRDKKVIEIASKIEQRSQLLSSPSTHTPTPKGTLSLSVGCYASKIRAESALAHAINHTHSRKSISSSIRKIQQKGRTLYQAVLSQLTEEDVNHITGVLSYFHIPCQRIK